MHPLFRDGGVLRWFGLVWLASLVRGALWLWWRRTGFRGADIRPWAIRLWAGTVAIMVVAVGAIGASALASHLPQRSPSLS